MSLCLHTLLSTQVFWDVPLRRFVGCSRRFERTQCSHLQALSSPVPHTSYPIRNYSHRLLWEIPLYVRVFQNGLDLSTLITLLHIGNLLLVLPVYYFVLSYVTRSPVLSALARYYIRSTYTTQQLGLPARSRWLP